MYCPDKTVIVGASPTVTTLDIGLLIRYNLLMETVEETLKRYTREYNLLAVRQLRDRRQTTRKYVLEVKKAAVCADCEVNHPHYILEFDHVTDDKVMNIASLAREGDMAKLLEEIAKCEIVCSNCHAHRTWTRSAAQPRTIK